MCSLMPLRRLHCYQPEVYKAFDWSALGKCLDIVVVVQALE
jgi:hypothetical protein